MEPNAKIYVAGHRGLVGSAVVRRLQRGGYDRLVTRDRRELDLTEVAATEAFFEQERPEYVFVAAAKVGGIRANDSHPADFIRINLQIHANIIDAAYRYGTKKLLFLGSSCIYPRHAPQPMREEHLMMGKLEPTNDAYAVAKIAGIVMCKSYNRQHGTNFIAAMPTNLYGPGDNFDLETSHVLPALLRKFHEAKVAQAPTVQIWGSGTPRREFMYVDDLADALVFLMNHFDAPREREAEKMFVNVGVGTDVTIRELAELIQRIVGYRGKLSWNTEMPDGMPRKLLDVSRLRQLGWQASVSLEQGIRRSYDWYLNHAER